MADFADICPFADIDQHQPEHRFFPEHEPTRYLALWACVIPPLVLQYAALLGRVSWMRSNAHSYRAVPPRPRDNRFFGNLTLFHHGTTGVSTYAVDSTAQGGGFHLLYNSAGGATLFGEP